MVMFVAQSCTTCATAQDVQQKFAKSATGNFCSAVLRTRSHTMVVTFAYPSARAQHL
jgi:hypothetical protein